MNGSAANIGRGRSSQQSRWWSKLCVNHTTSRTKPHQFISLTTFFLRFLSFSHSSRFSLTFDNQVVHRVVHLLLLFTKQSNLVLLLVALIISQRLCVTAYLFQCLMRSGFGMFGYDAMPCHSINGYRGRRSGPHITRHTLKCAHTHIRMHTNVMVDKAHIHHAMVAHKALYVYSVRIRFVFTNKAWSDWKFNSHTYLLTTLCVPVCIPITVLIWQWQDNH